MECKLNDQPQIAQPGILITNAYLAYHGKSLFVKLNFAIQAGLTTCLLGPSGVGKTSLLRLIAGLECGAEHGEIIRTTDKRPLTGRVAYLAQQDLLMPWYSVLNNVLLGLRLRGEKITQAVKAQALALLAQVELSDVAYQYPEQLSGGMRQRVALVRTLMEQKSVILMDEPFAALDTITRMHMQNLTAKLLHGKTVLLVTHDPLEALRMGHHVHVMSGSPATLDKALQLAGRPPRDPGDPELLIQQAELLRRLTKAKETLV